MKNEIFLCTVQILLTLCQYKESRAIDDYGLKRYSDTYYDTTPSLSELALLNGLGIDSTDYIPDYHHHHHDIDDTPSPSSLYHHDNDLMIEHSNDGNNNYGGGDDSDGNDHYYDYYANGFGYENDPDIEMLKYKMDHHHHDYHDLSDHYNDHHHLSEPIFPFIPSTPTFRTKNTNNKKKRKKNNNNNNNNRNRYRWGNNNNNNNNKWNSGFNKKKKSEIKPVFENRPDDFMYDFRTKLHSFR